MASSSKSIFNKALTWHSFYAFSFSLDETQIGKLIKNTVSETSNRILLRKIFKTKLYLRNEEVDNIVERLYLPNLIYFFVFTFMHPLSCKKKWKYLMTVVR